MGCNLKKNEKVIITNSGETFSSYRSAFIHFKLNTYEECLASIAIRHDCPPNYDYRIWTVKDAAFHHWGQPLILLLESNDEFLVIGEKGVESASIYNKSYYPTKDVLEDIVHIPRIKEIKF